MSSEFLTTREVAAMLRVKERKIYDLVSEGAIPVRRVTGKLLFPRVEIEQWIAARTEGRSGGPEADALPCVMAGGHDPLLEWALRESRSGIAAFFDGALDGLDRAMRGECFAAGLHVPEPDGGWNVAAAEPLLRSRPWVLIEWAKRTRGLVHRRDLGRRIEGLRDAVGLRFQARQAEAGSELIFAHCLRQEGLDPAELTFVPGVERSESDLAQAIAAGRADIGFGIETAARQFDLAFRPMIEERFDLAVSRRAYFEPPFQTLLRFCRGQPFRERAAALGGYDIGGFGTVRANSRIA